MIFLQILGEACTVRLTNVGTNLQSEFRDIPPKTPKFLVRSAFEEMIFNRIASKHHQWQVRAFTNNIKPTQRDI